MVKSTGIIRKVDELGRVVIPIELRRVMGIEEKNSIEIFVDSDRIILQKHEQSCVFCGSDDEVRYYKNKLICEDCLEEL